MNDTLSYCSRLRSRLDEPVDFVTEAGNSARLGVIAVTTFRTECLRTSLAVHSRFLAMKKSVAVQAVALLVRTVEGRDGLKSRTSNDGDYGDNHHDGDQTTR